MDAAEIKTVEQWSGILDKSAERPILVIKLSPICPISASAEREFSRFLQNCKENILCFTVDVISAKNTARTIAEDLGVTHQSPQALFIFNKSCIWHESHFNLTEKALCQHAKLGI